MWFNRLSRRINLLLTVLSLIVSYVAVIWQAPKLWYVLIIITIPACIVFTVLLPRRRNIPVKGTRNLDYRLASEMLASAVNLRSYQYPLCTHLTVIHTNGTAVTAIMARAISTSIRYLHGMLLQRQEEMQKELIFTPDVVERHLKRLRRIQAIASGMVSQANLIIKCYCQLPDAAEIYNKLDKVSQELDDDVLEKMDDFYKGIPGNIGRHVEVEPWKTKIHDLIKEQIPRVLIRQLRTLFEAEEPAVNLHRSFEDDWHNDLMQLRGDQLCKPFAETAPERPQWSQIPHLS